MQSTSLLTHHPIVLDLFCIMNAVLYTSVMTSAILLWKVFKNYLLRSPLDQIPGPPSDSLLRGGLIYLLLLWPLLHKSVHPQAT